MGGVVLITGSSTGIGFETAKHFASHGWKVVATMRTPEKCSDELLKMKNVDVLRLDVLDVDSIQAAVRSAVERHARIDVVVNNAGYPLTGDFESSTREQVERQIGTNLIGLIDVTREVIPVFKSQGGGMIINISSIAGRIGVPGFSVYNATKWGVEGLSEALFHELKPDNIKVKIIEPGIIRTDFYGRSMDHAGPGKPGEAKREPFQEVGTAGSPPAIVARKIFKAATSKSPRLRYGVGKMSGTITVIRRILPERLYLPLIARASR